MNTIVADCLCCLNYRNIIESLSYLPKDYYVSDDLKVIWVSLVRKRNSLKVPNLLSPVTAQQGLMTGVPHHHLVSVD